MTSLILLIVAAVATFAILSACVHVARQPMPRRPVPVPKKVQALVPTTSERISEVVRSKHVALHP